MPHVRNKQTKQELSSALRSGKISSASFASKWHPHRVDGTISRANAMTFLRDTADEARLTLQPGDLERIVEKCTNTGTMRLFKAEILSLLPLRSLTSAQVSCFTTRTCRLYSTDSRRSIDWHLCDCRGGTRPCTLLECH